MTIFQKVIDIYKYRQHRHRTKKDKIKQRENIDFTAFFECRV